MESPNKQGRQRAANAWPGYRLYPNQQPSSGTSPEAASRAGPEVLPVSGLVRHKARASASSDDASETIGSTSGSGNSKIGPIGNPGKSCLGPRALEPFFAVTLSEGL